MQLPISCAGPSSSSEPAAALIAYRTGISWQTTRIRALRSRQQALVGIGVAPGRVVQALATGKGIPARVLRLPGPVVVDRPALELADVDVVEQRLDLDGDVASFERDPRRCPAAPEARVHAEVEPDSRQLQTQRDRLGLAPLGQPDRHGRIAVDAA